MTDAIEELAQRLFGEKYSNYHDANWDEVSERCRSTWRHKAEKIREWRFELTEHRGYPGQ